MNRRHFLHRTSQAAAACIALPLLRAEVPSGNRVLELGTRRELFIDDFLIDSFRGNAALHMHQPQAREMVATFDRPWEGNTSAYITLFQDRNKFRMYYRGSHFDELKKKATHPEVTCYAESRDGIHWTKPELGLVDFEGSRRNNIVWAGIGTHNFTPFKDLNPTAPRSARYKALSRGEPEDEPGGKIQHGLYAIGSPDGVHWTLLSDAPVITEGAFDSQNLAFWDEERRCYLGYHRSFRDGVRDIMTTRSDDFLHWSKPEFLSYGGAPQEHLYTNAIRPYFRAPHLLIGFPTRFQPRTEQVEPILMSSRDGKQFHRWKQELVPITAPQDRAGNRSNYMAHGLLEIPGHPGELSVYATEAYYTGPGSRLRRFAYRTDGFVSIRAGTGPDDGVVTKPFRFKGRRLFLNIAAADGSVKVELQDGSGTPIPGRTLEDCLDIHADAIEHVVSWARGNDLKRWAGRTVRLRIQMRNADLYSLRFG